MNDIDACAQNMMRRLAQAQAQQQEYRILQAMREKEARQKRGERMFRQVNLLLGANGLPPFTMHANQADREVIKDVEVEVVDTKPARKQLLLPGAEG